MTKPDYNNSIMNITNSVLKHYGIEPYHATLPIVDELLMKEYKNVVFLLMDGMGVNVLERNLPENAFLRKHLVCEISSVFPSTTTAATTSVLTGKTPAEHGRIGWSCYFKELDKCIDLFSNYESGTKEPASIEHQADKCLSYTKFLDRIDKKVRTCKISPYWEYNASTMKSICRHIKNLCEEDGSKFIYAYHSQPDNDMHHHGISSKFINVKMEKYNNQLEVLTNVLSDTLFIISADHGMTDITVKCIEDYPQISDSLIRHICVEPRCCSMYVKDEYKAEFPGMFSSVFSDKFQLFTHDEFLQSGLLGEGEQHIRIDDFVGDYIAVAISDITLWYKDINGKFKDSKAAHGGLTKEELCVPLIIIER